MILLDPIVQILVGPMAHIISEFGPNCSWITVMPIRRHPGRREAGYRFGGLEERLGGRHVAGLAQPDVYQCARCVDGAIEIAPPALHFDVGFVDVPTAPNLAAAAPTQSLGHRRRELGFPIADRLIAEYDAADEEHLSQVSQAEFVAQTPEYHEGDDVGRILGPVQQAGAAFVELFAAGAATEAAIALDGALRPLRDGRRAAFHTPHPSRSLPEAIYIASQPRPTRQIGATADRTAQRPPVRIWQLACRADGDTTANQGASRQDPDEERI